MTANKQRFSSESAFNADQLFTRIGIKKGIVSLGAVAAITADLPANTLEISRLNTTKPENFH